MDRFWRLAQLLIVLLATFAALRLAGMFPFYYSWDMDLVVLQDIWLFQDDQLPTHYIHPGFGMDYLLFWIHDIAQNLGLITNINISSLAQAKQPLLIVAEQMEFLRQVNALFCIFLALIFWKAFEALLKPSFLNSTLLLVLFLLTPALWNYNISLIRTETYSVIFWGLSLLFTFQAAQETLDQKRWQRLLMLVGFFSTLSFFTKIQSFFLIIVIPLIYTLLRAKGAPVYTSKNLVVKRYVGVFIILSILSIVLPFADHVTTFRSNWLPNKFFFVLCGIFYLIYLVQTQHRFIKKWHYELNSLAEFFKLFLKGACFVLILPFLIPINIFTSFFHSLLTFKVIFLRHMDLSDVGQFSILENLPGNLHSSVIYYVALVVSAVGLVWVMRQQNERKKIFYIGAIFFVLLLHSTWGVRYRLQDRIWLEIPIIALVLINIFQLKRLQQTIALILLIAIQGVSLMSSKTLRHPPEVAYFDPSMFFKEVYRFGQYEPLFAKVYNTPEKGLEAVRFSAKWSQWKSMLAVNLPALDLDLTKIIPFQEGFAPVLEAGERLTFRFTADVSISIFTPLELKEKVKVQGCDKISESEAQIGNKKFWKLDYQGALKDHWTHHLLSTECVFTDLDLSQQYVKLAKNY